MIDLQAEHLVNLAEAARLIPPARRGKRTHLSTILRWIIEGARTPIGDRVQLEGIRLGGRWMTSREALQRFGERLTPKLHTEQTQAPRSPTKRQRASERAAQTLDRIGI
jgi:hypothetical protein